MKVIKVHIKTSTWQRPILRSGPSGQGWNQCGPP